MYTITITKEDIYRWQLILPLNQYGRSKLPRKLKKLKFKTKKLRMKYIPQYYDRELVEKDRAYRNERK